MNTEGKESSCLMEVTRLAAVGAKIDVIGL